MKKGILLIHIGTPDAPTVPKVRKYLRQFLSDPGVMDLPAVLRYFILYFFILPFRPKRSAHAYQQIWTPEGSPLLVNCQKLADGMSKNLGSEYKVVLGMRYGNPSLDAAVKELKASGVTSLSVVPLFPQYSEATTGSCLKELREVVKRQKFLTDFRVIEFLDCFVAATQNLIQKNQVPVDHWLLSFHGLPVKQIVREYPAHCLQASDCCEKWTDLNKNCYRAQCFKTARDIATGRGWTRDQYTVVFQSRLGPASWIGPEILEKMRELRQQGVVKLGVLSPSFTADCLETIEEIGMRAREHWLSLGGESFDLMPCPNGDAQWISGLSDVVRA